MRTKDYEIVADAIRPVYSKVCAEPQFGFDAIVAIEDLVGNLSEAFLADNPRFHKATFYRRAIDHLPSEVKR